MNRHESAKKRREDKIRAYQAKRLIGEHRARIRESWEKVCSFKEWDAESQRDNVRELSLLLKNLGDIPKLKIFLQRLEYWLEHPETYSTFPPIGSAGQSNKEKIEDGFSIAACAAVLISASDQRIKDFAKGEFVDDLHGRHWDSLLWEWTRFLRVNADWGDFASASWQQLHRELLNVADLLEVNLPEARKRVTESVVCPFAPLVEMGKGNPSDPSTELANNLIERLTSAIRPTGTPDHISPKDAANQIRRMLECVKAAGPPIEDTNADSEAGVLSNARDSEKPIESPLKRSIERLESETPQLDIKSVEWISARKENEKKLGLPIETLRNYRAPSKGGRTMPNKMFGIDRDGRRWRRIRTSTSTVYYFAVDIKKALNKALNQR